MLFGYIRVSTKGQAKDGNSLEGQRKKLIDAGVSPENIFSDTASGKELNRPAFDKLLKLLKSGDVLVVCKLDRFARTAIKGVELIEELIEKGISVNILNMGMMDNTPTGRLIRTIFLAFAEFERDLIVERTQEGKAIAKENNPDYREGRPRKFGDKKIAGAFELLKSHSVKQVSEITGISESTIYRAKRRRAQGLF